MIIQEWFHDTAVKNSVRKVRKCWQYENVGTKKSLQKRLERLWHGSRDSARTPVQWDNTDNAVFTTGTPWFYVNENYREVNVADQETDKEVKWNVPGGFDMNSAELILNNYKDAKVFTLKPYEARVYKWDK